MASPFLGSLGTPQAEPHDLSKLYRTALMCPTKAAGASKILERATTECRAAMGMTVEFQRVWKLSDSQLKELHDLRVALATAEAAIKTAEEMLG